MNKPISKLTPELNFLCTIGGINVFSNGTTFSVDEQLPESALNKLIDYLCDEGFVTDPEWCFLT
jgi:hypothetical protein